MKVIGITGGIASGKSTVTKHMRELGLPVFDADVVAHQVLAKGMPGLQKVIAAFGDEYLCDGELNRAKLADFVFHNPDKLKQLNEIVHEMVWQAALRFEDAEASKGTKAVVLDVPLLIETGWYKRVDEVWLVKISVECQIQRVMKRDGVTEEQARARIAAQMSTEEKAKYARVVIDNSGKVEDTLAQVDRKVERLLQEC